MKTSSIKIQVKSLPSLPGVYQFFNKEGGIIYIGIDKDGNTYGLADSDSDQLKIKDRLF